MKRRDFIRTTLLVGTGLAIGAYGTITDEPSEDARNIGNESIGTRFRFPIGGCTEAGFTLLDKGPRGPNPFGFSL